MKTGWPEQASDWLLRLVLMAMAFCRAALLLRDGFAIALRVPLDPNEGWNAYHALAAATGGALYPRGLMINNYPPLSFYVVGALGRSLGDDIIAGRLVSLLSFLAIAMILAALIRQFGGRVLDSIFAALFFGAMLLIASDYVAMDDPQLLGHALQIEALLLLLRERPATLFAALLLAAGLFVKQNLFVLPLAALIWLALTDRRELLRLAGYGAGFALAGLLTASALLQVNLLAAMASPRLWTFANLTTAMTRYLSWAALPLLLTGWLGWRWRRDSGLGFAALYAVLALLVGLGFCAGDGVDANIFFDCDIALALAAGLALGRAPGRWRGPLALGYVALLALFLARHFTDDNFTYTEPFQKQAPLDVAFLEVNTGPGLCENLALCYWAGKDAEVDVFNATEQFRTGARDDAPLIALLQARHFRIVQLDDPDALGPAARAVLKARYRVDYIDDNGLFFIPR